MSDVVVILEPDMADRCRSAGAEAFPSSVADMIASLGCRFAPLSHVTTGGRMDQAFVLSSVPADAARYLVARFRREAGVEAAYPTESLVG
jgi:hypothetical protein